MSVNCFECGWTRVSRTRSGQLVCPRCGTKASLPAAAAGSEESLSRVVKVYTMVLVAFALVFPFLVPAILHFSRLYPMEFGSPL